MPRTSLTKQSPSKDVRVGSVVFTDPSTESNTIRVVPTANKSASTSAGGAISVDNSNSTGAGVVVYSTQAAPSGRLLAVRVNSATFNQAAVYVDYNGTGHAATVNHSGTGSNSNALVVTSTNASDTALGVSGNCDARGTVKITHNKSGSDANASILSCLINGSGTACQGIFLDTETGVTTTGKLINLRQDGTEVFVVDSGGRVKFREQTDPSAPATNEAVLYARDNGSGKTQLCVRFPTGAVQVLATEP